MNAKKILAVLSFVLIAIFLMGCNQEDQVLTPVDSLQKNYLTPEEVLGVIDMIWSEKLARDVYTAFYEVSGDDLAQFSTIAASEQGHMDRLIYMLTNHSEIIVTVVTDEVTGEETITIGEELFPADLQAQYDAYILYPDPLVACLEIEQSFIDDYTYYTTGNVDPAEPVVVHPSLFNLYGSLLLSSENHLAAFTK
ncbi:MAG: DUF2202 domain-containing protein [Ignavibacteriaceae bacterium]|nr:DUF2202 domain-containing protein [Ignavibacteriaceae bacterium]